MARLGKVWHEPGMRVLIPGQRQDIVEIQPGDLPSGTGTGKDYVIVVQAIVGPHTFTQAGQEVSRVGLHSSTRGEIAKTWTQLPHAGSPLINTRLIGIPIQIVHRVQDWGSSERVRFGGYITTGTGILVAVSAVLVMLIDLTAFGGARVTGGWDGDDVVYREAGSATLGLSPVAGTSVTQLLNAPLPWTSGTDTWVALYSQELHPKSDVYGAGCTLLAATSDSWSGTSHHPAYIRSKTNWIGTNGALDGGNRYSFGTWNVRSVTNATSSWRLLGGSHYPSGTGALLSMTAGGAIVCLKLNALDGGAASEILGYTEFGAGNKPGMESVLRNPAGDTPRDMSALVQMTRATTAETYPDDPDHWIAVQRQNGWLDGLPPDNLRAGHFWVPTRERIPMHGAVATPPGKLAASGGAFCYDDRYHVVSDLFPPRTYNALDWSFAQFGLSNDGAIDDPPPPVLSRVVLTPDREAVLASLATLAVTPYALNPLSRTDAEGNEVLTAGQYRIRWGSSRKSRRVVEIEWTSLTEAEFASVLAQIESGSAVKFTVSPDTTQRAWHFDLDTFTEAVSTDGLRTVRIIAYELTWLT